MCLVLAESSIYQPSRTAENWSSGSSSRVITKVVVGQEGRRERERESEKQRNGGGGQMQRHKEEAAGVSRLWRVKKRQETRWPLWGSKDHVVRSCLQCSLYQQADLCRSVFWGSLHRQCTRVSLSGFSETCTFPMLITPPTRDRNFQISPCERRWGCVC